MAIAGIWEFYTVPSRRVDVDPCRSRRLLRSCRSAFVPAHAAASDEVEVLRQTHDRCVHRISLREPRHGFVRGKMIHRCDLLAGCRGRRRPDIEVLAVANLSCRHETVRSSHRLEGMVAFIKSVTFDCNQPLLVATFWAQALGSNVDEDSSPDRAWVEPAGWGGPSLWFVRVPEHKRAKNRLHFDLRPMESHAHEVNRLLALGATVQQEHDGLTVMIDPEGNEFCVE